MSTQAAAYDLQRSMSDEWEQRRQTSEMQRIEQAARYRQMELNDRMQDLERRERIERSDNDWRQRQLEAENYRPGWRRAACKSTVQYKLISFRDKLKFKLVRILFLQSYKAFQTAKIEGA